MIVQVNIRWGERKIDFCMDLDQNIPADYAVLYHLERQILCEPETCHVLLKVLQEGDAAVDGGANVGFFTLLMSKLVGPSGQVLAFEPGEANLKRLRGNLDLNGCKNVKVIEKPLWSSVADVNLHVYKDGGANSLWAFNEGDKASPMRSITLDAECGHLTPRLIKLDIEGAELRALRGAWNILKNKPVLIVEMNEAALERAGASFAELRNLLLGFDCFVLSDTGHFPTYIPPQVKMHAVKVNTNVMFSTLRDVTELWQDAYA